jgi:HlyD family secretion protein
VARLGRETDRETREFLIDVRLRQLPPNWTLGQRAEVFITTARKREALSVPPRFITWREGKPGVFVEQKGKAVWRDVKLGLAAQDRVEVVEGLSPQEKVVTSVAGERTKIKAGQRVRSS